MARGMHDGIALSSGVGNREDSCAYGRLRTSVLHGCAWSCGALHRGSAIELIDQLFAEQRPNYEPGGRGFEILPGAPVKQVYGPETSVPVRT